MFWPTVLQTLFHNFFFQTPCGYSLLNIILFPSHLSPFCHFIHTLTHAIPCGVLPYWINFVNNSPLKIQTLVTFCFKPLSVSLLPPKAEISSLLCLFILSSLQNVLRVSCDGQVRAQLITEAVSVHSQHPVQCVTLSLCSVTVLNK